MFYSSQVYLPAEMVQAILMRVEDEDEHGNAIKHGLTSCSLTCRHWAAVIRPMLFRELTLRSAEDISQLLAFLSIPDFLGCALVDCVVWVYVVADCATAIPPWGHQITRLDKRLTSVLSVILTINGSSADRSMGRSSLLFHSFPRTLPLESTIFLGSLRLSHLQLPSVQCLVDAVAYFRTADFSFEAITFVEKSIDRVRRRRSPFHSRTLDLKVSRCFQEPDSIILWIKVSHILCAQQTRPPLDDVTQILVEEHLLLLLQHTRRQDRMETFRLYVSPHNPNNRECSICSHALCMTKG